MKKIVGLLIIMLFLISFTKTVDNKYSLEGTWELVDRYNYDGINVTDTLLNSNGYQQVKIYSKGKVMWTRYSPNDPAEWFGYGDYKVKDEVLEERLQFGSKTMMKIRDTVEVFNFKLQLEANYYKQITLDDSGNPIFSENYKRID
ncbi:MAG: hypothetical protein NWQ38_08725 [Cellulophaga sp.]|nr:hypothetical protein [Cellulophaga sp.]